MHADLFLFLSKIDWEVVPGLYTFKKGAHAKMIGVRERIGFVIVATVAGHGEPEKGAARRFHKVSHQFCARASLFIEKRRGVVLRTQPKISGGYEQILFFRVARLAFEHFIAGELLNDELVEWFVFVERTNGVIAEAPRGLAKFVPIETIAVAVTHDIQPLPCPMFPVAWRVQQLVNEA